MAHRRLAVLAAAVALASFALPASAANHLIKVVEVFPGTVAQPNAQYVVLQMYDAGQYLVNGLNVAIYDASDTLVTSFTFTSNVPNGAGGAKILLATPEAETLFGVTADLAMTPSLPLAGGAACWGVGTFYYDCLSWGSFVDGAGGATGTGTPYRAGTGLTQGQAVVCDITTGDNPAALDANDCLDSAADHDCGDAQPLANPVSSTPGFLAANPPCPVCGDNATNPEIGEECDGTDDGACPGGCKLDCTCYTEQILLGKLVLVKDPQPSDPTHRKVVLKAKEGASPSPVTGDPITGGAMLKIAASGTTPSSQTFTLPGGAAFWTPLGSLGFKYKDTDLVNGPIKLLLYKKTGSGTFLLTVVGKGSMGTLSLTPPNTATEARASFIPGTGGDRYCVAFGGVAGGTLDPNDDRVFKAKDPTGEGLCPP